MRTVAEWKQILRDRIVGALKARDAVALSVLRETLAAIDNAEAPPPVATLPSGDGPFAGSVSGAGAAEVARLDLAPADVLDVIVREVASRRSAAAHYLTIGRHAEAEAAQARADLVEQLLADRGP